MSTPPKTPKGQREGISYAHKNRDNLPRANAPSGLSKTHVGSNFYVASNPERVRQQREEQIAKQIKAERLFRPSPHVAYGPGKAAPKQQRPKHKRPHIPPGELKGIEQRMTAFKKARMNNEAAKAQSQDKPQAKSANLDKMARKAAFMAQRQAQNYSKTKTHKR